MLNFFDSHPYEDILPVTTTILILCLIAWTCGSSPNQELDPAGANDAPPSESAHVAQDLPPSADPLDTGVETIEQSTIEASTPAATSVEDGHAHIGSTGSVVEDINDTASASATKPREIEVAPESDGIEHETPHDSHDFRSPPDGAPAPGIQTDFHAHQAFDKLLQKHVSRQGAVNYAGIVADKQALNDYLESLRNHPPKSSWTRPERLAYWINVYNAFTIKLIVDNYPVASIMNLDGGKAWDRSWIKIGAATYSLNDVEHKVIRPKFNEPRIHFAVNCAAKSCPPLANQAYTASNVETLLDQRTRSFINDAKYNEVGEREVRVSKIFEWYAADFGDLISYLNRYAATQANASAEVSFLEYDWALNE